MLLMEGKAHVYVFASPGCKKWDTCAPQAILEAAGGVLTDMKGATIPYHATAPHRYTVHGFYCLMKWLAALLHLFLHCWQAGHWHIDKRWFLWPLLKVPFDTVEKIQFWGKHRSHLLITFFFLFIEIPLEYLPQPQVRITKPLWTKFPCMWRTTWRLSDFLMVLRLLDILQTGIILQKKGCDWRDPLHLYLPFLTQILLHAPCIHPRHFCDAFL